ncbi:4903_t:CDS:2 [Cetraspora pellucida]|uniref:4903_t:CDS:1 n=1 Tax=Cetraspora pellucida TaxID=1433469 RepID=A0A9N8ZPX9_9GLOM|nr:4903_t:CDS:2 [Cetraspora pellucida]
MDRDSTDQDITGIYTLQYYNRSYTIHDMNRPRQRVSQGQACDRCRRLHLGCNDYKPCDKCTKSGSNCSFESSLTVGTPSSSSITQNGNYVEDLSRINVDAIQSPNYANSGGLPSNAIRAVTQSINVRQRVNVAMTQSVGIAREHVDLVGMQHVDLAGVQHDLAGVQHIDLSGVQLGDVQHADVVGFIPVDAERIQSINATVAQAGPQVADYQDNYDVDLDDLLQFNGSSRSTNDVAMLIVPDINVVILVVSDVDSAVEQLRRLQGKYSKSYEHNV